MSCTMIGAADTAAVIHKYTIKLAAIINRMLFIPTALTIRTRDGNNDPPGMHKGSM